MKWTYTIKNKIAASVALFGLCLLVLISNFIDRNHTDNVKNAISTLYEDRLVAEAYILKMTTGVYQIREILNQAQPGENRQNAINDILVQIKAENHAYLKTKFTEAEQVRANTLVSILEDFEAFDSKSKTARLASANEALEVLGQLSAIQLEESKQIMADAEALYITGKTSSQFVFAIIVLILLVLQGFVFTAKSLVPKNKARSPSLN